MFAFFCTVFHACQRQNTKTLDNIQQLLNYDSIAVADSLLSEFHKKEGFKTTRTKMRAELLLAEWKERAGIPFDGDSTLVEVVNYFSENGSENERNKSKYLLGCCYYSMQLHMPARLLLVSTIQDADTTAENFDYSLMLNASKKLSEIYEQEGLYSSMGTISKQASYYALKANDSLAWIHSEVKLAMANLTLRKYNLACKQYEKLIPLCVEKKDSLSLIKCYMDAAVANAHLGNRMESRKNMAEFDNLYRTMSANSKPNQKMVSLYYSYKISILGLLGEGDSLKKYFIEAQRNKALISDKTCKGIASSFTAKGMTDDIYSNMDSYFAEKLQADHKREENRISKYQEFFGALQRRKREEVEKNEFYKRLYWIGSFSAIALIIFSFYRIRHKEKYKHLYEIYVLKCDEIRLQQQLLNDLQENVSIPKLKKNLEQIIDENNSLVQENLNKEDFAKFRYRQIQSFESFGLIHSKILNNIKIPNDDYDMFLEEIRTISPKTYKLLTCGTLSEVKLKVCVLVMLRISTKGIGKILYHEPHSISTTKQRINAELFKDNSAKGLEMNLLSIL